jgi:hypothetical protein
MDRLKARGVAVVAVMPHPPARAESWKANEPHDAHRESHRNRLMLGQIPIELL